MLHLRADWLLRYLRICAKHEVPLAELWADPTPTNRFDIAARLRDVRPPLEERNLDREPREASAFEVNGPLVRERLLA